MTTSNAIDIIQTAVTSFLEQNQSIPGINQDQVIALRPTTIRIGNFHRNSALHANGKGTIHILLDIPNTEPLTINVAAYLASYIEQSFSKYPLYHFEEANIMPQNEHSITTIALAIGTPFPW